MKNGYKIDFVRGTITLTKAFSAQARVKGSQAYNTLVDLQKELPHMRFVMRTTPKARKASRLTYEKMKKFIKYQNDSAVLLVEFEKVKELAKEQGGVAYQNVKRWFLQTFPNYNEIPSFDEKGNLISDFGRKEQTRVLSMEQTAPAEKQEEQKTA